MTIVTNPKHPDFNKEKYELGRAAVKAMTEFVEKYGEDVNVYVKTDKGRYQIQVKKDTRKLQ